MNMSSIKHREEAQNKTEAESMELCSERFGSSRVRFAATTRRIPLLIFLFVAAITVLIAGALAHGQSSWNQFWHQEAVLKRSILQSHSILSFFDRLASKLNWWLIRGGWIVLLALIVAVQAFYLQLISMKRDRTPHLCFLRGIRMKTMLLVEVAVLSSASIYFLFFTTLFDWIGLNYGSCNSKDGSRFEFIVSRSNCSGTFRGFDISGHCFIIVHSCLLILEYAVKVLFVWKCPERNDAINGTSLQFSDKDSDLENPEVFEKEDDRSNNSCDSQPSIRSNTHLERNRTLYFLLLVALMALCVVFCLSESVIFLQTILFFHTVTEKLLGTFIGGGFWLVLFYLSRKYPHLF